MGVHNTIVCIYGADFEDVWYGKKKKGTEIHIYTHKHKFMSSKIGIWDDLLVKWLSHESTDHQCIFTLHTHAYITIYGGVRALSKSYCS